MVQKNLESFTCAGDKFKCALDGYITCAREKEMQTDHRIVPGYIE